MTRSSTTKIGIGVALALVAAVVLAIVIRPDTVTDESSLAGTGLGMNQEARPSDDSEPTSPSSPTDGGRTEPSSGKPAEFPSDGQPVAQGLSCLPRVCPIAEAGMRIHCQCNGAGLLRHQWTYDGTGRLVQERRITSGGGIFEDYYEDGVLRMRTSDIDGDGNVVFRTTYDENGQRATFELMHGDSVSRTVYEPNGTMTTEILRGGRIMYNTIQVHDEKGNLITQGFDMDGDGEPEGWEDLTYNESGGLLSSHRVDAEFGLETETTYDEQGRRVSAESYDAEGCLYSQTRYDEAGNEVERLHFSDDGNLRNRTATHYDSNGNELYRERFDADGNLLSRRSFENGREQSSEWYDAEGRVERRTARNYEDGRFVGESTTDGSGRITQNVTEYCDDSGLPQRRETRNGDGDLTRMVTYGETGDRSLAEAYDAEGRVTTRIQYNEHGERQTRESFASNGSVSERIEYNDRGDQTSVERYDAAGDVTELRVMFYDESGNIVALEVYRQESGVLHLERRCVYDPPCPVLSVSCLRSCEPEGGR